MRPPKSVKFLPESVEVVLYFRELKRLFDEQYPDPTLTDYVNEIKCVKKLLYGEEIGDELFYENWIKRFDMTAKEASNLKDFHVLHQKSILYEYEYFPPKDVKTDITERHSHVYAYAFQEYLMYLYSKKELFISYDTSDNSNKADLNKISKSIYNPKIKLSPVKTPDITITASDKLLRELRIIYEIFYSQLYKCKPSEYSTAPIYNKDFKKLTEGCYFTAINIYSETELFNLQKFKAEITNRFENALRPTLLLNQLIKIKENAENLLVYYFEKVSTYTKFFNEFYNKFLSLRNSENPADADTMFLNQSAIVNVSENSYITSVFIGDISANEKIIKMLSLNSYLYYKNNLLLESYCKEVVEFIDSLGIKMKEVRPANSTSDNNKSPKNPDLTLRQIALLCFYKGRLVTRENGNDIAKEYGHNSGEKLFQLFVKYSSRQNRIVKDTSHKKSINKIVLFESVINLLDQDSQEKQRAIEELNTLKASVEKDD